VQTVDLAPLAAALAPRSSEMVDELMDMLLEQIEELRGDEQVVGRLRASIESNVATLLHLLEQPMDIHLLGPPAGAVQWSLQLPGGWFHSGDLGVLTEDGVLSVVDRKKDMIKTGGENVASREVEEALYELEGVAEVAVFGISHPQWIEAVTAVLVPTESGSLLAEDVHAHARTRLAPYKRPKYLVITDALPKNPSGKVVKRTLREQYAGLAEDPAPGRCVNGRT
jgi:acyl-CoA synthetase (AMP-forming)/AMP-acid ligase II